MHQAAAGEGVGEASGDLVEGGVVGGPGALDQGGETVEVLVGHVGLLWWWVGWMWWVGFDGRAVRGQVARSDDRIS